MGSDSIVIALILFDFELVHEQFFYLICCLFCLMVKKDDIQFVNKDLNIFPVAMVGRKKMMKTN